MSRCPQCGREMQEVYAFRATDGSMSFGCIGCATGKKLKPQTCPGCGRRVDSLWGVFEPDGSMRSLCHDCAQARVLEPGYRVNVDDLLRKARASRRKKWWQIWK